MGTLQEGLTNEGLAPATASTPTPTTTITPTTNWKTEHTNGRPRCTKELNGAGLGKSIFVMQHDADVFNAYCQKTYGHAPQRSYQCSHFNHWHLTSLVEPAPQPTLAPNGWTPNTPLADLSKGMVTKSEKVLALLRKFDGTKTPTEIAGLAGCSIPTVTDVAKKFDLPYKGQRRPYKKRSSDTVSVTPVTKPKLETLEARRARLQEELRQAEQAIRQEKKREEERKRIVLKADVNGDVVICGNAQCFTLAESQLFQLFETLKTRYAKPGEVKVAV